MRLLEESVIHTSLWCQEANSRAAADYQVSHISGWSQAFWMVLDFGHAAVSVQFEWWHTGLDVASFETGQAHIVIYFSLLGFVSESGRREEVKVCSF